MLLFSGQIKEDMKREILIFLFVLNFCSKTVALPRVLNMTLACLVLTSVRYFLATCQIKSELVHNPICHGKLELVDVSRHAQETEDDLVVVDEDNTSVRRVGVVMLSF